MFNITEALEDGILTLTVDLNKKGTASKSGKSIVIASTKGNVGVTGKPEIKYGLNVYMSRV